MDAEDTALSVNSTTTTPSDAPLSGDKNTSRAYTGQSTRRPLTTSSPNMPTMASPPPLARTSSLGMSENRNQIPASSPVGSYQQTPSYSNIASSYTQNQAPAAPPQPPLQSAYRKRNRDAWDRRIQEQMWYYDSHSAAHPRNNPAAQQEDTIDSYAHGQDFGTADLSKRKGGDDNNARGRKDEVNDTTHLGGAIMVAGESGRQAEAGTQSMYGSTADACVATVITTADLAKLIPFPDEAVMLRATLPSLRRLEKHASQLLGHIRREIESQVQDAGVSYANTSAKAAAEGGAGSGGYRSRKGQLGSQSIAALRKGLAEKTLEITGGNGGALTSITLDDRGRMNIKPGTTFTGRTELAYSGGGSVGKGPAVYFDPLGSRTALSATSDSASFGKKEKLPFTGVTGYTLYDEQAKTSSASLLTLGEEVQRRHMTFDTINESVQYQSPLAAAGPWTRELDVITKGLGPIAHQQVLNQQRQAERERKELLRQVAEGLIGSGGGLVSPKDQYETGSGPSFGSNSHINVGSFAGGYQSKPSVEGGGGFGGGGFAYTVTPPAASASAGAGGGAAVGGSSNAIYQSFSDDPQYGLIPNASIFNNSGYIPNTSFAGGYSFASAGGRGAMGSDSSSYGNPTPLGAAPTSQHQYRR